MVKKIVHSYFLCILTYHLLLGRSFLFTPMKATAYGDVTDGNYMRLGSETQEREDLMSAGRFVDFFNNFPLFITE